MLIRKTAAVCLLSTLAPLAAAIAASGLAAPSTAAAQDVTEVARQKFREGVEAFDHKHFEEARSLFLQAYALKRHPAVLLNLGQAEIRSGYFVDGGNHLQQFLREFKEATPEQQKTAKDYIAEAQKKAGFVIVIVDVDGADVTVDGAPVGRSPLLDPVFVEPGPHEVSASIAGARVVAKVDAKKGVASAVSVPLRSSVTGPLPQPPAPVPVPAPGPDPSTLPPPAPSYPPPGYPPPAPEPGGMFPQPPFGPTPMPPDNVDTGREDFFPWFARKPGAWVGAGFTGLGVVGVIAFSALAAKASSATDDVTQQIVDEINKKNNLPPSYYEGGEPRPCGKEGELSTAFPYYSEACGKLQDDIDAYNIDMGLLGASIAVTVLAAGGTVIYYFVDTANSDAPPSMAVMPFASDTQGGLGLVGAF